MVVGWDEDVAEVHVGYILDQVPAHLEAARPLVLLPELSTAAEVHRAGHLCHTTELAAAVHLGKGRKANGEGWGDHTSADKISGKGRLKNYPEHEVQGLNGKPNAASSSPP